MTLLDELGEQIYRLIVETADDGVWVFDSNDKTRLVNPKLSSMLGYAEEELIGRSLFAFTEGEWIDLAAKMLERLRQGNAQSFDFVLLRKDGTPVEAAMRTNPLHDADGRYMGALAMVADVTESRRAERELQESEERYRYLVERLPVTMYIEDDERNVTYISPQFSELLGIEQSEWDGDPRLWERFLHPDDEDRILAAVRSSQETRTTFAETYRLVARDRRTLWVHDETHPIFDPAGRLLYWQGILSDITDRSRLEEQLRQAQKMEALGRIAGGVAHDFNNLLTAIIGYGESIAGRGGDVAADAEEILRAADRAVDLVKQLLAFSRRQILEQKVLDLNTVVQDVEQMLSRTLGEHISIANSFAADLRPVRADPGQLEQVVLNLAVNARDAMPSGGVLTLETRNVVLGDDGPLPPGAYVQLTVTDTGDGMTEDVRRQVFEPFFTTKEAGKGTGLGLATVYGIVSQSGGHVSVYSEPGLGTSFEVFLPASDEPITESRAVPARPAPARAAVETVLLVEDEAVVRSLVREILERDGYTVLEASEPEEALAAHDRQIDLLLTDVVMPRMSGPEIARSLAAARSDLKVLYMSGYSDAVVVQRGLLEPGTAFIQKPFRAQELTDKVRTLLER